MLFGFYDFGIFDELFLFKLMLVDVIWIDEEGVWVYFVGGNLKYLYDGGFLNYGWKKVEF